MRLRSRSEKQGFTLIEMLVVMVVLSILIVAGLAAFGGSGEKARRAVTDQMVGLVEQARTKAITSRSHVAVAFALPGSLPQHQDAAAVSLVRFPDDWNPQELGRVETTLLTRWRPLEKGVIFLDGDPTPQLINPLNADTIDIRYATRQTVDAAVHILAFNPRGRLVYPVSSDSAEIRIAEGAYLRGNAIPYKKGSDSRISETRLKVGRVIGRCYEFSP